MACLQFHLLCQGYYFDVSYNLSFGLKSSAALPDCWFRDLVRSYQANSYRYSQGLNALGDLR